MTIETLAPPIVPLSHFVIVVSVSPAIETEPDIRVTRENRSESDFAVEIGWGNCQTQCRVGPKQSRVVVIIIGVNAVRPLASRRLIVAELKQVSMEWIHLAECRHPRNEPRAHQP